VIGEVDSDLASEATEIRFASENPEPEIAALVAAGDADKTSQDASDLVSGDGMQEYM